MPAPNFDSVSRLYRFLEYGAFGPALWHRRIAYLPEMRTATRVLMAGEGDGRFLRAFLRANANATVDYIDASPRMTALARSRAVPHASRVQFLTADALSYSFPSHRYDLIITHFFLDCFLESELPAMVNALARAAAPRAKWVVSEFNVPARAIPAAASRALIGGLYRFFALATGLRARQLPAHAPLLGHAGFTRQAAQPALAGILLSEFWTR